MPIIGLTDRAASFPRIGILRKGAPKPNERQPGRDLNDHFRLETDFADVADTFKRVYGEKPNHLRVLLMFPSAAENFEAWKEHHSAGALKRRCDGQTCVQQLCQDGTYDFRPTTCVCATELSGVDKKHLCRPVGRLKVVVPELARLGYLLVPTTSIHDIIELQSNLEAAEALRGDLRGIPFVLARRPRKVSTPGTDGQRARREKWLLSIEPAPDWVRLQIAATQRAALPMVDVPQLPAPVVDRETGEILDEESDEAESVDALRAELKRARRSLTEAGGTPWSLGQNQVLRMAAHELRAEIDATWQALQTLQEAADAAADWPTDGGGEGPEPASSVDPETLAEWEAIEAAEAAQK